MNLEFSFNDIRQTGKERATSLIQWSLDAFLYPIPGSDSKFNNPAQTVLKALLFYCLDRYIHQSRLKLTSQ
jgi:hypothetical protein